MTLQRRPGSEPRSRLRDQRGSATAEYVALVIGVVGLVTMLAVSPIADSVAGAVTAAFRCVPADVSGACNGQVTTGDRGSEPDPGATPVAGPMGSRAPSRGDDEPPPPDDDNDARAAAEDWQEQNANDPTGDDRTVTVGPGSAGDDGMTITDQTGLDARVGPVSASATVTGSVTVSTTSEDGTTTWTMNRELKFDGSVGGRYGPWSLQQGQENGLRYTMTITAPEGADVDPSTIDPFDPDTIPPGTRVVINQEEFDTTTGQLTWNGIGGTSSYETAEGNSLMVERTPDGNVRVTTGPTDAIRSYQGATVGYGDLSLSWGLNGNDLHADLDVAEFELSTPEGQAAFQEFVDTGTMPTANEQGVNGVVHLQTYQGESGSSWELDTPVFTYSETDINLTVNDVIATDAEGAVERLWVVQHDGMPPLEYTQSVEATGDVVDPGTFAITFRATEETASLYSALVDEPGSTAVQPGRDLTLTFDHDQVQHLLDNTVALAEEYSASFERFVPPDRMPDGSYDDGQFLAGLLDQGAGGFGGFTETVWRLHNGLDGADDPGPIPYATVSD